LVHAIEKIRIIYEMTQYYIFLLYNIHYLDTVRILVLYENVANRNIHSTHFTLIDILLREI